MPVTIKGFQKTKRLQGTVNVEVNGTGIPNQFRVYFTDPLNYKGDIYWLQDCIVMQTGEVLDAVRPKLHLKMEELNYEEVIYQKTVNGIVVKTITCEELLESLKQFYIKCADDAEKNSVGTGQIQEPSSSEFVDE